MEYAQQFLLLQPKQKTRRQTALVEFLLFLPKNLLALLQKVNGIGVTAAMNTHEISKLGIFNHLNFIQLITGIVVPVVGLSHADRFPAGAWLIVCLPSLASMVVLIMNACRKHEAAILVYFFLYPVLISFSYLNGINLGLELYFILYGILSVFFLQDLGYMIFSIAFSMISYFVLSVTWSQYPYQFSLEQTNYTAYLVNQGLAILYTFYGLYLIKTENANNQVNVLLKNTALEETNLEIKKQASQLQGQAEELDQLNSLKNKVFSVISHDLRAPMYALRNLFDTIQKQDMPAGEIKALIPVVKKDLNNTVGLMENLLQWAKSQMHADSVRAESLNLRKVLDEVVQLLHLQAEGKNIRVLNLATEELYAWADRDMISLVLRNLVSNAIKFTKTGGSIFVGANEQSSFAEIYVQDTGTGISAEHLKKINSQGFYTSNGTAQEEGTGLGLMLCKEFLAKNGGRMRIETEAGKGSIFSFTLPLSK